MSQAEESVEEGSAPLTYALIAINLVVFALTAIGVGPTVIDPRFRGIAPLVVQFGVLAPAIAHGEVWRLLTAGFLHFGLAHVGFNMFALYQVGRYCEPRFGALRLATIYLVALLAGDAVALVTSGPNTVTAGASGAVMGVFGAMAAHAFRHDHREALRGASVPIGLTLLNGFGNAGVSNAAHIGGVIAGAALETAIRAPRAGGDLPADSDDDRVGRPAWTPYASDPRRIGIDEDRRRWDRGPSAPHDDL